jgi:aspartyl-tRNA synthetase
MMPEKENSRNSISATTYKESMEKYGNDRPDIVENKDDPNLLAFAWVIDFPIF